MLRCYSVNVAFSFPEVDISSVVDLHSHHVALVGGRVDLSVTANESFVLSIQTARELEMQLSGFNDGNNFFSPQ